MDKTELNTWILYKIDLTLCKYYNIYTIVQGKNTFQFAMHFTNNLKE